jgi:hypothetical protein
MRNQLSRSARHWLVVVASTLIALGVLVGVAQAGTFSGGQAAGRAAPRAATAAVIAPAQSCASIGQADFSALRGASTTILSATSVPAGSNSLGNYAAARSPA